MFSKEVMGKSIAIYPSEGKIYAPEKATVAAVFPTGHAIGLKFGSSLEMLIHVGIDTVNLNGEPFINHVKLGQKVKKGKLLLEFDIDKIKKANLDPTVIVIITNSTDYYDVVATKDEKITTDKEIFALIK
ncbi:MAG: PTS glucose transporter subunit IIA [Erysipelotrichaceae bacterium]|nr:PTS glucose transporter subunit IIA [Erysipelotrichaceae bacterium]MDY5727492.1 PTS glucose transporter subunit IIA [Erysipelotrichaceae bacterium]